MAAAGSMCVWSGGGGGGGVCQHTESQTRQVDGLRNRGKKEAQGRACAQAQIRPRQSVGVSAGKGSVRLRMRSAYLIQGPVVLLDILLLRPFLGLLLAALVLRTRGGAVETSLGAPRTQLPTYARLFVRASTSNRHAKHVPKSYTSEISATESMYAQKAHLAVGSSLRGCLDLDTRKLLLLLLLVLVLRLVVPLVVGALA